MGFLHNLSRGSGHLSTSIKADLWPLSFFVPLCIFNAIYCWKTGDALFYLPVHMNESSGFGTNGHRESRFMVCCSHGYSARALFREDIAAPKYEAADDDNKLDLIQFAMITCI